MHRSTLMLAVLFFVVISVTTSCALDNNVLTKKELQNIEQYIGQPFSIVEEAFGAPDMEGKNAIVSTYIRETEEANIPIESYQIFISWGDKIGCYGVKYFTDGETVTNAYDWAIAYMSEGGRTVFTSGNRVPSFLTEELRMSRRLDNLWEVDKRIDEQGSHVLLVVSDIESGSCRAEVMSEAMRIEQEYGIIEKEDEELFFHRVDI